MQYTQITCDTVLKKITKKDILFRGEYCLDSYQNCEFGCLYCDSSFVKTIFIKKNAADILEHELQIAKKGVIIVGSVHDPYQKAEQKYQITKKILQVIKKYDFPCHILTKSTLILRDIDILSSMDCTVTLSMISLDLKVSNIFEKNVSPPKQRLQTIQSLVKHGIKTGVALIPIIPYIIDDEFELIIQSVKEHNAQYFLYKHLELKGEQKQYFMEIIKKNYPHLLSAVDKLYNNRFTPDNKYLSTVGKKIKMLCNKNHISTKI